MPHAAATTHKRSVQLSPKPTARPAAPPIHTSRISRRKIGPPSSLSPSERRPAGTRMKRAASVGVKVIARTSDVKSATTIVTASARKNTP